MRSRSCCVAVALASWRPCWQPLLDAGTLLCRRMRLRAMASALAALQSQHDNSNSNQVRLTAREVGGDYS